MGSVSKICSEWWTFCLLPCRHPSEKKFVYLHKENNNPVYRPCLAILKPCMTCDWITGVLVDVWPHKHIVSVGITLQRSNSSEPSHVGWLILVAPPLDRVILFRPRGRDARLYWSNGEWRQCPMRTL